MSDAALVRRCLAGDAVAARELVERFQADVVGLCTRLLNHRHDAEDVAQEVFLRVFRSLKKWDATRPLKPWVFSIAVNRCRTAIGKRGKGPELADYLHETADRRPADDSSETADAIRSAVDALRADYREVFVLFHERGQAYEDIAEVIGRPVGTVKTWLHRARVEVMELLRSKGLMPEGEVK
ncbi:MAG: RNA polymerase sigma factor [Gemmataceae bacterium]